MTLRTLRILPTLRLALTLAALILAGCEAQPTNEEANESPVDIGGQRPGLDDSVDWAAPLSLEVCLRLAETNAGSAGVFRARVEAARAEVAAADLLPNPSLSLLIQDVLRPNHVEQALLGLEPLALWRRGRAQRSAAAGLVEAEARVAADRRALQFEVGRTFYGLVAAERLAVLEARAAAITSEQAAQVADRVAAGDLSALDLDRAEAEGLDARASSAAALLRLARERSALALALGAAQAVPVQVESRWPEPLSPQFLARVQQAALGGAESPELAHPGLAHARARVALAQARLSLENGRKLGFDQAILSLGVRRSHPDFAGVVALQVPLPFLDRNQGGLARALAELNAAEAALAGLRAQVEIQLRAALETWEQTSQALDDLRELVARREAIVVRSADLLEGRNATLQELLIAQRDALSARRRLIAAELDLALARWRLLLLCGAPPDPQE